MENNIDVTYKAAFFEKTEIRLCTIKTQKHINSDAVKLLRIRSVKELFGCPIHEAAYP